MRTKPYLSDLHEWLRWRVNEVAVVHGIANPCTSMCLIWGHRTLGEQNAAYRAGRSKLDGINKFSLHNYLPALAADLWVYSGDEDGECEALYEGRPPKGAGLSLELLQKGSLRRWYIPMGRLAKTVDLEAGALWLTFRDGPHVQVPKAQRMMLLQDVLNSKGFDVGASDGIIGPRTRSAIQAAKKESGLVDPFKSRLMPVSPKLWAWLHGQELR
tara:strand:+ start:931 stop:1572 length:642 start_codon:yes stop_codon:yes gene_type:complete